MGDWARLRRVPITLRPAEQYLIGRMLMLRERLAPGPWASFERTAEAVCDSLLERMPIDHPGSAAWYNRRKRPPGR